MKTIEELANIYANYHKSRGKTLGVKSFLPLTTFASFCVNKKELQYISQELVDEWCRKRPGRLTAHTTVGLVVSDNL